MLIVAPPGQSPLDFLQGGIVEGIEEKSVQESFKTEWKLLLFRASFVLASAVERKWEVIAL